jgi:quercetin dioxygenase-like cupin family protein
MSAQTASILAATEGETFAPGPFLITSRVQPDQTQGAFEMYELGLSRATVDYHVHRRMDETIYILQGEIEFVVAGERFVRQEGAVAFIPRGLHHGFSNHDTSQARVLLLFTPATNQAEYFRALERLFAAPMLDTAALQSLQLQYDQELIDLGEQSRSAQPY